MSEDLAASSKPRLGVSVDGDQTAFLLMEDILDKLKMLNYEKHFVHKSSFKPLTHTYFAMQHTNPNEQSSYFMHLCAWLMAQGPDKHEWKPPGRDVDPNTAITSLMVELKKIGAPSDFPPHKLRQGYGEAVCSVLNHLCDASGLTYRAPVHHPDGYAEEAAVDDEAGLGADGIEDDIQQEEEEEEFYMGGRSAAVPELMPSKEDITVMKSKIDPEKWKLELERVMPQLKLQVKADVKDWRNRMQQTKQHQQTVGQLFPQSKGQLQQIGADVQKTLDQVKKAEEKLNMQCQTEIHDYAAKQEQFSTKQDEYNKGSEYINRLTNELAGLTEDLATVKAKMDERGSSMTDTSPLVKIKNALTKLKSEAKSMDIRIGVVAHTLVAKKNVQQQVISHDSSQLHNAPTDLEAFQ